MTSLILFVLLLLCFYKQTLKQICFFWWTCLYKCVQPFLHSLAFIAYSVGSLFEWAVRPLTLLLTLFFFGIFVTKCNSKACDPGCTFDLVFNRNWVFYGLLSLFLCPTCAAAPVCCWYCYSYGVYVFVNFYMTCWDWICSCCVWWAGVVLVRGFPAPLSGTHICSFLFLCICVSSFSFLTAPFYLFLAL